MQERSRWRNTGTLQCLSQHVALIQQYSLIWFLEWCVLWIVLMSRMLIAMPTAKAIAIKMTSWHDRLFFFNKQLDIQHVSHRLHMHSPIAPETVNSFRHRFNRVCIVHLIGLVGFRKENKYYEFIMSFINWFVRWRKKTQVSCRLPQ